MKLSEALKGLRNDQNKIKALKLSLLEKAKANADPQDWPEDFSHENGNYSNVCGQCKRHFTGHKRRHTCKICAAGITLTDQQREAIRLALQSLQGSRSVDAMLEAIEKILKGPL